MRLCLCGCDVVATRGAAAKVAAGVTLLRLRPAANTHTTRAAAMRQPRQKLWQRRIWSPQRRAIHTGRCGVVLPRLRVRRRASFARRFPPGSGAAREWLVKLQLVGGS